VDQSDSTTLDAETTDVSTTAWKANEALKVSDIVIELF
jgi:hypothetical protein